MECTKRYLILGVGIIVALLAAARPANAQDKEARGTVTAVTDSTLTIKAGAQDLTFYVDGQTHLEVRAVAKQIQQAQPGSPKPRVSDFFQPGGAVLVRYREEKGRNHALDIQRAAGAGGGGGSVSDSSKIADGKVKSITSSRLVIEDNGRDLTFGINRDTDVFVKGATKAMKAAGGPTTIDTFVHVGDTVSIIYKDIAGAPTAAEVRVRVINR